MRRRTVRILIGLLAVIVVIAIVVQLVLWSQLPKNIILPRLEKQLGLRIQADKLTTGWLGYTTLDNVQVSLPLAQKAFLNVPQLKLKENSVFALVLTRALGLEYIEIDRPDVQVLQNTDGTWNLAEVAELLAKAGGGKEASDTASSGVPSLPNVRLLDGTVTVLDNRHHAAKLSPLSVNGYAGGALVWNYEVAVAQSVTLQGKVAPGGNWQHVLSVQAHHLDALVGNFGLPTYNADLAATWNGQLNGSTVNGTLRIEHATATDTPAGNVTASGAIDASAAAGVVTLSPRSLDVLTKKSALPEVKVATGSIVYDASGIHLNGLQVSALGGAARVNGSFDLATFTGNLDTRWSGMALTSGISHSGSLVASLKTPISGHPDINVQLTSRGRLSSGGWDVLLSLVGQGESWKSIDWVLTAPQLSYTGSGKTYQFTNLIGHVTQRYPSVQLTSLTLPARPHLTSGGQLNLASKFWYFWVNTGGTPHVKGEPVPIDFFLNTWGTDKLYTLKELDLAVADTNLWAAGAYDTRKPSPVSLDVYLIQSPQPPPESPIQGHVRGSAHISGKIFDENQAGIYCDIGITGDLRSRDLVVLNHTIGDTAIHLQGSVKGQYEYRIYSTEFEMFQGRWKLLAHGPLSDHGLGELTIDVDGLPIEELATLVNVPNVTGTVEHGQFTLVIPQSPSLTTVRLSNSALQMRDLRYGTTLEVDRADVIPSLDNGLVTLKIGASSNQGGYAGATVNYDLATPKQASADYEVQNWVYPVGGSGSLATTAIASVPMSHATVGFGKPFTLETTLKSITDVKLGPAPFAHAEADLHIAYPVITLSSLNGRVLQGTFDGRTTIDLSNPLQAFGQLHWYNVDAGAIVTLLPNFSTVLDGLGGTYSGTITLGPAREPRPKGPVRVDVNVAADKAHYRSVEIGDHSLVAVHAVAYASKTRAILDECNVAVAGGTAHLRARVDRGFKSGDLLLSFHELQLDQLAHVVPKLEDKPLPGLLSGSVHLISSGFDLSQLTGQVEAGVTNADLGNFGPIAAVYNLLHPGGGSQAPEGTGSVTVDFEQAMLRVTDFHYFNRGIDAHGVFTVGPNILDFPNVPVTGQVAGTVQPLSNTRLPFFGDFNQVFAALQSNLTTIDVSGTAAAPQYAPASLADIGTSLKELLVGTARADNGG